MSHGIENFSLPLLQALSLFEFSFIILYQRRPRLLRYVEGIFTSVCISLCVRSFSAMLSIQNRLVNREIELWVTILDILNWEGILLYLMYCKCVLRSMFKHIVAFSCCFLLTLAFFREQLLVQRVSYISDTVSR